MTSIYSTNEPQFTADFFCKKCGEQLVINLSSFRLKKSPWMPLTKENEHHTREFIRDKTGYGMVYEISILETSKSNTKPLTEIAGKKIDELGIVYIGKQTGSYELQLFLNTILGKNRENKRSSSATKWLEKYANKYGSNFRFRYVCTKPPSLASHLESLLIQEYEEKNGSKVLLNKHR